jgi:predicted CxxxxCH...CXXCH cytochrome family protein
MKRLVKTILAIVLLALTAPLSAGAVDAPHYDPASGITCVTCHTGHLSLGSTGYNNTCLNCHRPGDPAASMNSLTLADAANPFQTHSTSGISKPQQTSHNWEGPDVVPSARAVQPILAAMTSNNLRARTNNGLACVRCHDQHSNVNGKFLRTANDQDQLCLDCHRSRNVTSHLQGSHPVSIDYDAAAAAKPAGFNATPVNANPANPTSDLNARLNASGRKLLCSTCHGVHYTDSRSSTVDGRANFATLSSGDGYLLHTDRRGAAVAKGQPDKTNLCTNCHAGKKNHNFKEQDVQCDDCHSAHVDFDAADPSGTKGTNIFLIRRNVLNKASGQPASILFRYTASQREYKNDQGTGVCQGCHVVPLAASPEHASNDPRVCNTCHFHNNSNGSFSGACTECHGNPPTTATSGGPTGMVTDALGGAVGAHFKHVRSRGMLCIACHNGYAPPRAMPSNTLDIGFNLNSLTVPGFTRPLTSGSFVGNSNTTGITWGSTSVGTTVTTAPNSVTCTVYCHGTTLTPPRAAATSWVAGSIESACGACHGASSATPPTTGSHPRHAGATSGQLALGCDQCHGAHTDNSHITGNVQWDLTLIGGQYIPAAGTAFSTAGSTSGPAPSSSFGSCTNVYCHSSAQGVNGAGAITYQTPAWGSAPLDCGGCHKNMATDATGTGSHRAHTNAAGMNLDCTSCHLGYTKTTSAPSTHVNGLIELGAAGISYSQGNGSSNPAGNGYGSCSSVVCHGSGIVPWGGTLWSTTDLCGKCHSSSAPGAVTASAPFYNTSYPVQIISNLDVKTGAHTAHITSSESLHPGLACIDCHGIVNLNDASHMNGVTNFNWSVLARTGNLSPSYNPATGMCSNVYCHGNAMPGGDTSGSNKTPVWNNPTYLPPTLSVAGCSTCHGFPPPVSAGHPAVIIPAGFPSATVPIGTTCNCHGNVNPAGLSYATIFVDKALHINGTLEGGKCNSCHGYPPASAGFAGTLNNWTGVRAENYPGGGGSHTINSHVTRTARPEDGFAYCSNCHEPLDHQTSPTVYLPSRNIKVRINQNLRLEPAKLAKYTSNRLDGTAHQTGICSNISCHFGASPKWDQNQ